MQAARAYRGGGVVLNFRPFEGTGAGNLARYLRELGVFNGLR